MNEKSSNKNKVVTIRLTDEQYAFLENWKKRMEEKMDFEMKIEIPIGALIRRTIDKHMHDFNSGKFNELSPADEKERLKKS